MPVYEERFREDMARASADAVSTWANAPGDLYAPHSHPYRKVLCCLEGSIVFHVPTGDVRLGPGDRIEIEPGSRHSASVGPDGVRCAEAHFG